MKEERSEFKVSVLIVDDEASARDSNQLSVTTALEKLEYASDEIKVSTASGMEETLSFLRRQTVHVLLLDRDLGRDENGKMVDGIEHIGDILDIQPSTQILIVTGHDDTRLAVRAMGLGACAYIVKSAKRDYVDYRNEQIMAALSKAKAEIKRNREKMLDRGTIEGKYVCRSKAMQAVEIQLKTLAQYPAPVLFLGKTGLGKTVAAKRLGQLRAEFLGEEEDRPFFNINMANVPKELADSTLFGHERGAFTGAESAKQGLFELANGGDLFLDEIGEIDLAVQAKLLKVIEEKEFCRVGGSKTFKTNARIILATNRNLVEMMKAGQFREDLYARISTFDITLPPLEQRKEDIPFICREIIRELTEGNKEIDISYDDFPSSLKEYLQRDHIPFNIRGIRNDIERLIIYSMGEEGKKDFSKWKSILGVSRRSVFYSKKPTEYIRYRDLEKLPTNFLEGVDFPGIKAAKNLLEKKLLKEAVLKCRTKKKISKILKLSESNIMAKMNKYNISTVTEVE
ncbi:MAG: sigma 54-interacting transcriptional regulator [Bacteriovoracales bacterium]|nr:sigma 54-interacting transcriptional regulator [Bacteriovoracales bacterium]